MDLMIPAVNISFGALFTMIFSGTFGLMGLIFLAVGLSINGAMSRKRSRCTARTEGAVSAMQAQFGSNGLRAVYRFTIDGKELQYVSNYAGNSNLLIGQSVGVYYDPEQIGCVYIEEDAHQMKTFARVFTILGCVFLFIAMIVAIVLLGVL